MKKTDWGNTFPAVPESFHDKVNATLMHLPERKEQDIMDKHARRFSLKKGVVIAAAATMVLGTSVFAAGRIVSMTATSSSEPTYTEFPSAEQMEKDLGISPNLVETFQNGYNFEEASVVDGALRDENGSAAEEFKSLDFRYGKDGSSISLDVKSAEDQAKIDAAEEEGDEAEAWQKNTEEMNYQDVNLEYSQYTNKFVPADYEMTEEDKAAAESGDIVFSYGADEPTVFNVQTVSWEDDGASYVLQSMDDNVSKSDLVSMAQELIDQA
ncbi:MAG: hypothetical protein ACOX8E_10520 [Ruminococcus sp.]|jgi:hypothetical protein